MDPNDTKSKQLCKELMGRLYEILQSGKISDCKFLVGQEPDQEHISANKTILAAASPVFEAMFYGSLAEKKDPILVPDISPANFKILLSYIYTDEIIITSIEQASEMYYSAKKFMLSHLERKCSNYLIGNVDYSSACCVYEYGQFIEDEAVKNKATDIMSRDTKRVLNNPSFLEINVSTLVHLFSLEKLSIDTEIDLLEAAVRYNEARRLTSQNDLGDKAELPIQEAIAKIRFLTVSSKEFADCKVKRSFFSESEILAILLNIALPDTEVPYPKRLCNSLVSRTCIKLIYTYDFHNSSQTSSEYKANNFTWKIMVNTYREKWLGIFLCCCPSYNCNRNKPNWSCKAKCQLKVISRTPGNLTQTIILADTFEFKYDSDKFGTTKFVSLRDPQMGFLKNNAITMEAYVTNIIGTELN